MTKLDQLTAPRRSPADTPVPAPPRTAPAPGEPAASAAPARARLPWSPLGIAMALLFAGTLLVVVVPVLLHSGEAGVVAHGLAFLLTGSAVAGAILYTSTLPA